MATKPTKIPRIATGDPSYIVEPPESGSSGVTCKDTGMIPGTSTPAQYANWWWNNIYLWCLYLQDIANQNFTGSGTLPVGPWTGPHAFTGGVTSGNVPAISAIAAPGSGVDAIQGTGDGEGNGGTFQGGTPVGGSAGGDGVSGTGGPQGAGGSFQGGPVPGLGGSAGPGVLATGGPSATGVVANGGTGTAAGVIGSSSGDAPGVGGVNSSASIAAIAGINFGAGAGVQGTSTGVGPGVLGVSSGTGNGIQGTGGGTSAGGYFTGGATGPGVQAFAGGGNAFGATCTGSGTSAAIQGTGGSNGPGFVIGAGGGNNPGGYSTGSGTGAGIDAQGGATGPGVIATAGGGNANGVTCTGSGTGAGVQANPPSAGATAVLCPNAGQVVFTGTYPGAGDPGFPNPSNAATGIKAEGAWALGAGLVANYNYACTATYHTVSGNVCLRITLARSVPQPVITVSLSAYDADSQAVTLLGYNTSCTNYSDSITIDVYVGVVATGLPLDISSVAAANMILNVRISGRAS